jgi:hypothetical protein
MKTSRIREAASTTALHAACGSHTYLRRRCGYALVSYILYSYCTRASKDPLTSNYSQKFTTVGFEHVRVQGYMSKRLPLRPKFGTLGWGTYKGGFVFGFCSWCSTVCFYIHMHSPRRGGLLCRFFPLSKQKDEHKQKQNKIEDEHNFRSNNNYVQ